MEFFDVGFLFFALPYTLFANKYPSIKLNSTAYWMKCTPIVYLALAIAVRLFKSGSDRFGSKPPGYQIKIMLALLSSAIGDIYVINFEQLTHSFLWQSIIYFAIAHFLYISAFSLQGFNIYELFMVILIQILSTLVSFKNTAHFPYDLRICIVVYHFILLLMVWRGIVRARYDPRGITILGSHIGYTKLAGISFLISDATLGLTSVSGMIGPHILHPDAAQFIILFTYYFSQYCFAKSALV